MLLDDVIQNYLQEGLSNPNVCVSFYIYEDCYYIVIGGKSTVNDYAIDIVGCLTNGLAHLEKLIGIEFEGVFEEEDCDQEKILMLSKLIANILKDGRNYDRIVISVCLNSVHVKAQTAWFDSPSDFSFKIRGDYMSFDKPSDSMLIGLSRCLSSIPKK